MNEFMVGIALTCLLFVVWLSGVEGLSQKIQGSDWSAEGHQERLMGRTRKLWISPTRQGGRWVHPPC